MSHMLSLDPSVGITSTGTEPVNDNGTLYGIN